MPEIAVHPQPARLRPYRRVGPSRLSSGSPA